MNRPLVCCWFAAVALVCCGVHPATGRFVDRYTPDEFVEAADVVCNGIPLEIEQTKETGLLLFNEEQPEEGGLPMRYFVARVRVIGKYKGEVPAEIRVRYAMLDPEAGPRVIVDGPSLIGLNLKKRCRFYLKAPLDKTNGCYVAVQNGTFDDGRSVEYLADKEADDAPPFLQARAQLIATVYIRKTFPEYVAQDNDFDFNYLGENWWVDVGWSRVGRKPPEALATVLINRDGSVLPESWIVLGKPEPPGRNLRRFLGKMIQLKTRDRHDKKDPRITYGGSEYRGRVETVTEQGLAGHFIRDWNDKPSPMKFSRREIETIQLVAEKPR